MRGRDMGANEVVVRVVWVTLIRVSDVKSVGYEAATYTVSTTASSILRTGPSRVQTRPPLLAPPLVLPDASMLGDCAGCELRNKRSYVLAIREPRIQDEKKKRRGKAYASRLAGWPDKAGRDACLWWVARECAGQWRRRRRSPRVPLQCRVRSLAENCREWEEVEVVREEEEGCWFLVLTDRTEAGSTGRGIQRWPVGE